jgi:hypothetical protein
MAKTNKPKCAVNTGPPPELHILPPSDKELVAQSLFSAEPAQSPDPPPRFRKVKRSAIERQRIEFLKMIVSPMMAADLDSEYELVPINPQTRQARREPARRAIRSLYGAKIPDAAELPNKLLVARVANWLQKYNYPVPHPRTIRRAAGRK